MIKWLAKRGYSPPGTRRQRASAEDSASNSMTAETPTDLIPVSKEIRTPTNDTIGGALPVQTVPLRWIQYLPDAYFHPGFQGDLYILIGFVTLLILSFLRLHFFSKPPPVPRKKLPHRPALSILFKPDDGTPSHPPNGIPDAQSMSSHVHKPPSFLSSVEFTGLDPVVESVKEVIVNLSGDQSSAHSAPHRRSLSGGGSAATRPTEEEEVLMASGEIPGPTNFDLPDSFAPLLSSSETEILLDQLTADLIHGVKAEANVRLRQGRHEIPLDKDPLRPQFTIDLPEGGVKLSAVARVGSDGFSSGQDLDVCIPTEIRSRPMVKQAHLKFEPPMPLLNVAPTLIHIPTLFEDKVLIPSLRSIPILNYFLEVLVGVSSMIEKILWVIESRLQIHLRAVKVTPIYKGQRKKTEEGYETSVSALPEWRLSLSFSGHVELFGLIPIPFLNIVLPSFIIPQPHALLEYLLSKQPLASAKIKRENIAEEKIALAVLESLDTWSTQVEVCATPPAVGIDLTLPGGVSLGIEMLHGRDATAGRNRMDGDGAPVPSTPHTLHSNNQGFGTASADFYPEPSTKFVGSGASMSSWTTNNEQMSGSDFRPRTSFRATNGEAYNANSLVPWKLEFAAKGSVHKEKLAFHLLNCSLEHEDPSSPLHLSSQFRTRGSFAVWKAGAETLAGKPDLNTPVKFRQATSYIHRAALAGATEPPSVASLLLFPDKNNESFLSGGHQNLQYDYAFDVSEDSKLDAVTFSVGANHPMLNGGSMVTTILESIYAFGSFTARQDAVLDPRERRRKRNILRHLPAIDFTFGIQNSYIPPESYSYTDDGQTRSLPEMDGGRVEVRLLGGINGDTNTTTQSETPTASTGISTPMDRSGNSTEEKDIADGIKVIVDLGISSIVLNSETMVKEFPELDIFEGTKLRALTSAKLSGALRCHLRPQRDFLSALSASRSAGPNVFNPLEAYEVDCSGSAFSMRIKESVAALGHRRVIIPAETTIKLKIVESIVDMAMEGRSNCELSWDFQGLSPILQVTEIGLNPESVMHERKEQVSLLIAPLRQGRLNFHVSPVGGINITKAATSREDKEGLYDWKFFNALVSPDEQSAERLMDVVHDKRTMNKLLQCIKLINSDAHRVAKYIMNQVWRLKEVLDSEGVSDPKHIIPGHRMARLMSLLLCDDLSEVDVLLPLIRRVVAGDGLDVVTVKDLLQKYIDFYDDWTPEIDRAIRCLETMFSPITVPPLYVENNVTPLAQQDQYLSRLREIPSAAQLYDQIHDRPHLPLDRKFSNLLGRIAPYLSFHQIEYFLRVRASRDWQPSDLKRLRYVFSVKKRVMDIAESYGGLSFLPQSFLVSVFLGEATRSSLRINQPFASETHKQNSVKGRRLGVNFSNKPSTLAALRQRRTPLRSPTMEAVQEEHDIKLSAASRVASLSNVAKARSQQVSSNFSFTTSHNEQYELGDCLLGPADVAILLQAGLTSVMKGSSVVQLNQRMLLDLVASQPKSFAVAVLAEIGAGGQGGPRQLTSALLALLELDQTSFRPIHRLDMHALLESWLPGLKVPKREDYMAGGRWARQSYYTALFSLSSNILEDAECYLALKTHVQRSRHAFESEPIPAPRVPESMVGLDFDDSAQGGDKLTEAIYVAKKAISGADENGRKILKELKRGRKHFKETVEYRHTVAAYRSAFNACARVHDIDKLAFQSDWFAAFYKRNYDALMIMSIYENVINDVDNVRYWMHCLRRGNRFGAPRRNDARLLGKDDIQPINFLEGLLAPLQPDEPEGMIGVDRIFLEPQRQNEQKLIEAIIDAIVYEPKGRERLKEDPLVRLLIENPEGNYDFTVVTAMGVITDGKKGTELQEAMERLFKKRGVKTIRSDTATARSLEYNASRIIEAIEAARQLKLPYGLLGYSQGCANVLMAESLLFSGTPDQQQQVKDNAGLVSRQLLFSAANASIHGPAVEKKVQRLFVQVEEFFKYQQGYFSRALQSAFIEVLTTTLDSPQFHKMMGGAESFLADGCRAFWREGQHLAHVPTCTLRGVLEEHTTPEALEMLTNMLSKQSGSALHDSQVHVYDAVGHPVYFCNRNGRVLEKCEVGRAEIQRTHHWSPLNQEVDFVATQRDSQMASFDCAKDRHLFPWVEVNARFGFIKYSKPSKDSTS